MYNPTLKFNLLPYIAIYQMQFIVIYPQHEQKAAYSDLSTAWTERNL